MRITLLIAAIITTIFFIFVSHPMLLLFSILLFVLAFQEKLQKINNKIKLPLILKLIILLFIIGLITEGLAIWNNSNLTQQQIEDTNKLFSSNPLENIVLSFGYYIPLAIVWYFLIKKFDYKTKDIFIITGIFGIFFEGQGLVLISLNPLAWVYAFLIHSSYITMAYTIVKRDIPLNKARSKSLWKYVLGFLCSILAFVPFIIWEKLISFWF